MSARARQGHALRSKTLTTHGARAQHSQGGTHDTADPTDADDEHHDNHG